MKKYILLVIFSLFSITNGYAEMWDSQTLTAIDKADDLKIAPNRANGIHGTPTWIWEPRHMVSQSCRKATIEIIRE